MSRSRAVILAQDHWRKFTKEAKTNGHTGCWPPEPRIAAFPYRPPCTLREHVEIQTINKSGLESRLAVPVLLSTFFFLFALTIRQGALESKRNHKRASCGCSESRAELRKAFLKMRKRKEWVRHGRQPKWPVMAASMESCSRSPFCHGYFLHSGWLFFQQDIGVNDSQRVDLTDPPPYVMASGQKKTRPIPTDAWHTCVEEDTRWPEGASRKDTRLTYHPVEEKELEKRKTVELQCIRSPWDSEEEKKYSTPPICLYFIYKPRFLCFAGYDGYQDTYLVRCILLTRPHTLTITPLCYWPSACPGDEYSREAKNTIWARTEGEI